MSTKIKPITVVGLFDTNKEQRADFAQTIILALKSGDVNPLDLHMQMKKMEDVISQITANPEYKDMVLEEAQKHGKAFEYKSAKVDIREVGTKYDYSGCEDTTYQEMVEEKAALDKRIKDRQKFLQGVPEGGIVDPTHGNMVYRASKSSTTSVTVTLK